MNRFGYCCINLTLGSQKITTNRTMRQATFQEKGVKYAGEVAELNVRDLITIINWNRLNNINVFRMSSEIFPWSSEYLLEDLPNFQTIATLLEEAGKLAIESNQRLSFHPGPFNVLGSENNRVVEKTIKELETHAQVMDLLLQPRSPMAKINIHIGGGAKDRVKFAERWCNNFSMLSDSVKTRLTVENDDKANMYSVKMLHELVHKKIGIPIVFDSLHWACGPQDSTYEEAFEIAFSTWPAGTRMACHHSNSRQIEDKYAIKTAHSDFYYSRFNSLGRSVDVSLESKMKEQALFRYIDKFESLSFFKYLNKVTNDNLRVR